jgi:hypothetical protein
VQQRQRNPWKTLGFAIAIAIPALLVVGAVVGMLEDDRRVEELASVVIADSAPPASVVEECNRYADLERGEEAEVKRGAAPAGASADVAANAPGDAGKNASQRSPGTLVGMSEQNSRSAATRAAFRDCMTRKGYAS